MKTRTLVGAVATVVCLTTLPRLLVAQFQPITGQAPPPDTPAAVPLPASAPAEASLSQLESAWHQMQGPFLEFASALSQIWGIVILNGSDGKPLVTVGTLISGLVLMGIGYLAAKWISRWVGKRVLARVGLDQTAAAPVQSITFYVLVITFSMLTLNILNVPITVFSFLGGALAIGAGFGSQNIVNNFISGLILLAERPIRVGDVIQIDGQTGKVTEIGARSTRLSTSNNYEIVVPNSKLLEGTLVNWTLTDDQICTSVKVGVAYGAPTREVGKLLAQVASQHPLILKSPEPEVLFADFGDNALNFELRFWVSLRKAGRSEIESDLRYDIDEMFAKRGIVIAYPQRDVHLNVIRPVEVRLAADSFVRERGAAA
jgi:potassium efflux system protein